MRRGEIYFANLDPTIGSEIKKTRPILIVSNDANNRASSTVTVVPITTNTKKIYPFEVLLEPANTNLTKISKAQCHQVRTISKLRIASQLTGQANSKVMKLIDAALKLHLDLE